MPRLSSRATSWLAALLLTCHAVLAWIARAPGVETARDDAMYLQLARSLLSFSYRETWRPAAPLHIQYPPGYPLLLALTGPISGWHFDVFVALNIAASVLALFIAWRVVARLWSPELGLILLLALAPNPFLIERAGMIASEPLFMALSVAAVAMLARAQVTPRDRALAAALAIAAALTRSVGVSLLVAIGVLWLLERRWKTLALYAASALTAGAWQMYTILAARRPAGESYVGDVLSYTESGSGFLPHYLELFLNHFAAYASATVPEVLAVPTVPGTLIDNIVGAGAVAVCTAAGLVALWRRWRVGAIYLVCAFGLLMAWPWGPRRFVAPLLPILATAVLAGLAGLAGRRRPAWGLVAAAAAAVVMATTSLVVNKPVLALRGACARRVSPPDATCVTPDRSSFYAAAIWIRDHLPADAVIVNSKPETLAWFSHRLALPPRVAMGANSTLVSGMRDAGARWVLLGSLHWTEVGALRERMTRECRHLIVEEQFRPRTWLFRISAEPTADDAGCRAMEEYRRANLGRDFERDL